MIDRAAHRYANALYEAATELGKLDEVVGDMAAVQATIEGSRDLRSLLVSPVVKPDVKLRVLTEIFSKQLSKEAMSFLTLLVRKQREASLLESTIAFRALYEKNKGIVHASVQSAVELRNEDRDEITKRLRGMFGSDVKPVFTVDPSIRGGFVARVGDTLIDASLRHQLEVLREQFRNGGAAILN